MIRIIEYTIFYYLFFFYSIANAQPTIDWQKCYGGFEIEDASKLLLTSDGGYLLIGNTQSADGGDVSGNHLWFDSLDSLWHPSVDVWVLKTDSLGNIEWQKCLGSSGLEVGKDATETTDGFIVISGANSKIDGDITSQFGSTDFWIIKLNVNGGLVWQTSLGSFDEEEPFKIAKTPDGGFLISGFERSPDSGIISGHHGAHGPNDFWLVKLDSAGTFLWQKCIGGSNNEFGGEVAVDSMGYIYGACISVSVDGDVTSTRPGTCWVFKMDSNANLIWNKKFGSASGQGEEIYSLELNNDKLLICGWATGSDGDLDHNYGDHDAWILLIDTASNMIFSKSFGGTQIDEMYCAKFTTDNKIIASGFSNSSDFDVSMNHFTPDCWLMCLDSLGNLIWQNSYGGSTFEISTSLIALNNGSILFTGATYSPDGGDVYGNHDTVGNNSDIWLVKLNAPVGIEEYSYSDNLTIYPNPFSTSIKFLPLYPSGEWTLLELFNVMGEKLLTDQITFDHFTLDLPEIPDGIYFISLKSEKLSISKRIIKVTHK